jgi:nucleoside-diphosphate-sugar epimerase
MRHAVLGADGQIGRLLVRELLSRDHDVVAIARSWNGQQFGDRVEHRIADATKPELHDALAGCTTVYSTLGLPYSASLWEAQLAPLVKNVRDAAIARDARLIYMDNVYAYGPVDGWMTEDRPYRPSSRKGHARAQAAQLLLDAIERQHARIIIARAADFFGPGANSIIGPRLFNGVIGKTTAKRRVEWLGDPNTRHCYNAMDDVAAALATLGDADDADFGQTWHLPTDGPMTGHEFCAALGELSDCTVIPRSVGPRTVRFVGLFNPLVHEQLEMLYQFTNDYLFDDAKFKARFPDFHQRPFPDALADTLHYYTDQRPSRPKTQTAAATAQRIADA